MSKSLYFFCIIILLYGYSKAIAQGTCSFDAVNTQTVKRAVVSNSSSASYDLDVIYISRTPRTPRYDVTYNSNGPISWTGGTCPSNGQPVVFTAMIKNHGINAESCTYQWYLDGNLVGSGTQGLISSNDTVSITYNWNWDNFSHVLNFKITPSDNSDLSINNSRTITTNALSLRFHIEPIVYQEFNNYTNLVGTYSFEDWAQAHIDTINGMMKADISGEQVFLDEIVIENNLPSVGEHAPLDMDWDGRWGFDDAEWTSAVIQSRVSTYDKGLIHELGHQIGLIDEYNFNFDWNYVNANYVNQSVYYIPYQAIMNNTNELVYSAHSHYALKSNHGYRRGFFGEYLYDIPDNNIFVLKDSNNIPVANTTVTFYQAVNNVIDVTPEFSGTTDNAGQYLLPNRPVVPILTATNHVLHDNPFGQISVVGTNGLFLIKIESCGATYYRWWSLYMFNIAYWSGDTVTAYQNFVVPNCTTTGIQEQKSNILSLSVYPNPANDETCITYTLSTGSPLQIKLIDILGREINILTNTYQSAGDHALHIDTKALGITKGIYTVRILCPFSNADVKLIVK